MAKNNSYHTNEKNRGDKCPDQIIGYRNPTDSGENRENVIRVLNTKSWRMY